MEGPLLEPTIQTYVGMVQCGGAPLQRRICFVNDNYPSPSRTSLHALFKEGLETFIHSYTSQSFAKDVLKENMPNFVIPPSQLESLGTRMRIRRNILACRNSGVNDIDFMKRNIKSLKRLDLEQAAAVILSAIVNDDSIPKERKDNLVKSLIESMSRSTFANSCMWLLPEDLVEPPATKLSRFMTFTRQILSPYLDGDNDTNIANIEDWADLLPILLRIRRCRPKSASRCLFIPPWLFEAANVDPPPHHQTTFHTYMPGHEPNAPISPQQTPLILTRRHYTALQRRLNAHYQYWKPAIALRTEIRSLESTTLHNTTHLTHKILPSTSTLSVAHAFLSLQRRLQRKVVSDPHGNFLAAGASGKLMQNTPTVPTRFETTLLHAINPVPTERGIPIHPAALPQVDRCCLLMESYVQLYGGGDGSKLVFAHGERGGSGRGPVDEYNKLCDILSAVKEKAGRELGREVVMGGVRKFLAKDIMHWNRAWEDDAFAGGVVPGWVGWLERRRQCGVLLSEWDVEPEDEEMDEGEKGGEVEERDGGEMEMSGGERALPMRFLRKLLKG